MTHSELGTDPLRTLDTLDRYGWRVRWVTDLGPAVAVDQERLLLVDSSVTRSRAETLLLLACLGCPAG